MQAVVDHEYKFMDVMSGLPGSVHDARVFRGSVIYQKGMAGTLFPDHTITINGTDIPIFLVGDPVYPHLPWLAKPCPRGPWFEPCEKIV